MSDCDKNRISTIAFVPTGTNITLYKCSYSSGGKILQYLFPQE
jgi:hypothetical protein